MSLLVPHAPQAQGGKGSGGQRGQEGTSGLRPSAMGGVCRGKACTMESPGPPWPVPFLPKPLACLLMSCCC